MLAQIPGRKSVIHFTDDLASSATLAPIGGTNISGVLIDRGVPNPLAGVPPPTPDIFPNIETATNAAVTNPAPPTNVKAGGN